MAESPTEQRCGRWLQMALRPHRVDPFALSAILLGIAPLGWLFYGFYTRFWGGLEAMSFVGSATLAIALALLAFSRARRRQAGIRISVAALCLAFGPATAYVVVEASAEGVPDVRVLNECSYRMRQIGLATRLYAANHEHQYPPSLETLLAYTAEQGYTRTGELQLLCPGAARGSAGIPYRYVGAGLTDASDPRSVVLYEPLGGHGSQGMNVLLQDGTVQFVPRKRGERIVSELDAGHNPPVLGN